LNFTVAIVGNTSLPPFALLATAGTITNGTGAGRVTVPKIQPKRSIASKNPTRFTKHRY
jgi:hypothetical protein